MNSRATLADLKQHLRKKDSIELLMLEKDEHLQVEKEMVETLQKDKH